MRLTVGVTAFAFLVVLAGCGTGISVQTDYDPEVDFGNLKTYSWLESKGSDLDKYPLAKKRIQTSVERTLSAKGYTQAVATETPDFYVVTHAGAKEKMNVTDWGYSYGPYWGAYGPYGRNIDVSYYTEATLFIDIVRKVAGKAALAWRGAGTGVVRGAGSPEEAEENIQNAVDTILEDFPPVK